ncbi:hypothetical protein [Streptosporangium sp. NPDC000396]|uniref:hypothetical protein n=1 Tax=Streptosporangium sp. NPDC000396 TaxID=3366185 RepID=UPI0036B8515B
MPNPLTRRPVLATLLVLLLHGMMSAPATARADGDSGRPADENTIGIRLLEIPSNRVDDPRARYFIVDHVNPGTTFTRRLEVSSTSPKPQHVELYASAAGIKGSRFTFAPDRTSNELSSWIRLDRPAVDLPARGSTTVKTTVSVPAWAGEAERYAVIWAQVSSPSPGPKGNVAVVNRVGVRTYLDVGPGAEPPSDFQIGQIVPQRAEDGQPKVVVAVTNTGHRALDLDGQLSLPEGPSSLSAGPFRVTRGTTLAPGDQADIAILLGRHLPDGPWTFRLTLRSGHVEHTATGTLTFPAKPGTWGLPASLDSPLTLTLTLAGLLAVIAAVAFLLILGLHRRRARRQAPAAPPLHRELL